MKTPIQHLIQNCTLQRLLIALSLSLSSMTAHAGELYVIANSGVSGLALTDVRDVYLGKKQFAGSTPLKPVDNAAQNAAFLGSALSMDKAKYGGWWVKKSFQDGISQPDSKSCDAEVLQYVKSTPGAVGYIGSAPPAGVTTVGKF